MNYIKLLACTTLLNAFAHCSEIEYVESFSGISADFSYVKPFLLADLTRVDNNASPLTRDKEEFIRLWIESTHIFKMYKSQEVK